MANNRLWLVHRPTGAAVFLGKRMAWGWSGHVEENDAINNFFNFVQNADYEGDQDDFVLAIEDADGAPCCTDKWKYKSLGIHAPDGIDRIELEP